MPDLNVMSATSAQPAIVRDSSPATAVPAHRGQSPAMPTTEHEAGALDAAILKAVARRKKKKRGLAPGAPASRVTRGFQTPVSGGGDDSDCSGTSTPRSLAPLQTSSPAGSPLLRPSSLTRAISELKLVAPSATSPPLPKPRAEAAADANDQEPDKTHTVPIVRDFVARDAAVERLRPVEGGLRRDSPHRKMTASDFEPLKCLGKGAFGTVLLVRQRSTGRLFAQKQLKKASLTVEKRLVEQTKTERAILESVNRHPFVVKLFYAFQDHAKLYLILEYASGGELFHHLAMERTFTEQVSAFYMAEMVLALDHLHRDLGVVYRDLKPENCLLDAEGHLLLTDFGLSKVALEDPLDPDSAVRCNSVSGTIDYMAPEVVQGKDYDQSVDWWSLGAVIYDFLTGAPPFTANNHTKTQQRIIQAKLSLPYYLSPDAKDLLTRLMRKEPKKRLGSCMPRDMATIKGHRFFRKIDWAALAARELPAPIQPIITDPAAAENFDEQFTALALSPAVAEHPLAGAAAARLQAVKDTAASPTLGDAEHEHFGGFSYVASKSLLDFD